ncbi:MAG: zinc metallopeptidase [Eggerthellaceae bacterium]|nr:zinc metallopeptidase [Eggerthellaceae bacterium]
MSYWMLIIITLALGMGASGYVRQQLSKYSQVRSSSGLTGAQAAEQMLRLNGVSGVTISKGNEGQDHYDPRSKTIALSPSVFDNCTVTAYATACHEVGHACQHAQGYLPLNVRSAIVPVANLASSAWIFVLFMGIFFQMTQLIDVAIIMYALVVLFQVVTLPVEFNASHRALNYMKSINMPQGELTASYSVLRACALTYVAAALASLLQLVWLLGMRNN